MTVTGLRRSIVDLGGICFKLITAGKKQQYKTQKYLHDVNDNTNTPKIKKRKTS
jgi:hypothetical protein